MGVAAGKRIPHDRGGGQETERGRWFLVEHANRNRAADTESVLQAISRLEAFAVPAKTRDADRRLNDVHATLAKARISDGRPAHSRAARNAAAATAATRTIAGKVAEVALELRKMPEGGIYADALDLYCADLLGASGVQEAATQQLADLAALAGEAEEMLTEILFDQAPTEQTAPEPTQASPSPPIAPAQEEHPDEVQPTATELAPRVEEASEPIPERRAPTLMFVRPVE